MNLIRTTLPMIARCPNTGTAVAIHAGTIIRTGRKPGKNTVESGPFVGYLTYANGHNGKKVSPLEALAAVRDDE